MADMLTWLHLSDLHICSARDGWDSIGVLDRLIEDLKVFSRQYAVEPDLLFFTGDAAFGEIAKAPGNYGKPHRGCGPGAEPTPKLPPATNRVFT